MSDETCHSPWDVIHRALAANDFKTAALAAIDLADNPNGCPEVAMIHLARAQVYATLHQAETAVWIAENRRDSR